jgi:drug/metabolite transporter (DMT)-like permease
MKSQASAALGTIAIWLLINNAALVAFVDDSDLGNRSEKILLKQLEPLISQLALAALVGSAVIWLIGGIFRRVLALLTALSLVLLTYRLLNLFMTSDSAVMPELTLTGDLVSVDIGLTIYLAFAVSVVSALLYFWAVKSPVIDSSRRPNLKAKPDMWREQDEGRDGTA